MRLYGDQKKLDPFYFCFNCGFVFRFGYASKDIIDCYSGLVCNDEQMNNGIIVSPQQESMVEYIESKCKFKQTLDVGTGSGMTCSPKTDPVVKLV